MKEKIIIKDEYTKEQELLMEEEVKKTKKKIKTGLAVAVCILLVIILLTFIKGNEFFKIMGM